MDLVEFLSNQQKIIPRDEADPDFVKSFEIEDELNIKTFFDEFGFVIIRNVLEESDIQKTLDEIWSLVSPITETNPQTWNQWPKYSMERAGYPTKKPVFLPQMLTNRQNPKIHQAYSLLLGTPNLLVSHDRCSLYRPTIVPTQQEPQKKSEKPQGNTTTTTTAEELSERRKKRIEKKEAKRQQKQLQKQTTQSSDSQPTNSEKKSNTVPVPEGTKFVKKYQTFTNLHLDLDPIFFDPLQHKKNPNSQEFWKLVSYLFNLPFETEEQFIDENNCSCRLYYPLHLQGSVNLIDNRPEDGGLLLLPSFHKIFDLYFKEQAFLPDTPASPHQLEKSEQEDDDEDESSDEEDDEQVDEQERRRRKIFRYMRNYEQFFPNHRFILDEKDILMKLKFRISLRKGSLVIWDQRLIHGSQANQSQNFRSCQFIRMWVHPNQARSQLVDLLDQHQQEKNENRKIDFDVDGFLNRRRQKLKRKLQEANFTPSPLGRQLFDLK